MKKHIEYWLTKYTEMHQRADNRIDKMKISEEFFTEIAPGLIKQLREADESGQAAS